MFISRNRLKNIERHLQDLEDKQFEQGELIEFLVEHNKDDIITSSEFVKGTLYPSRTLFIKYIGNNCSMCKIETNLDNTMEIKGIEKVEDDVYVLYLVDTDTREEWRCKDKFLQLDKTTNVIMDITEIKARYENQEKVSVNLKESAQALGEAFKGIFGSCTKNECKCKKSSADKTKKQETAPKIKSRKNTKKEEK